MNAIVNAKAQQPQNDIIDINISGIGKKKIRINGDDSKILLINTSDNNIMHRLTGAYPVLKELEEEVKNLMSSSPKEVAKEEDIEEVNAFAEKFKQIDEKMCGQLDYIFNANVSEVCSDGGSMYDFLDGYLRYEVIFDSLSSLYTENLTREKEKIERRIKQHTSKYTG